MKNKKRVKSKKIISSKRIVLTISIIIVLILIGFATSVDSETIADCTTDLCPCNLNEGTYSCNSCTLKDSKFNLFILDVEKSCSGTEMLTCQGDILKEVRIDVDNAKCNYVVNIFGSEIASFKSKGEGITNYQISGLA